MRSDVIDLPVRLIHETEKAWKFQGELQDAVWIPKSAAQFDDTDSTLTLKVALAEEKGLV